MTVGKDVSGLFPDVVKSIQTDNLELKKLVYLYVINYAKSQPEIALLAVNTFQKACNSCAKAARIASVYHFHLLCVRRTLKTRIR